LIQFGRHIRPGPRQRSGGPARSVAGFRSDQALLYGGAAAWFTHAKLPLLSGWNPSTDFDRIGANADPQPCGSYLL